mmetsp:Transcript_23069/g.80414  ORF Transcript_23069/g.80414 Transcript_23069/m.80414 type:complete len:320 (-) Transcript_23069:213-1172(-)
MAALARTTQRLVQRASVAPVRRVAPYTLEFFGADHSGTTNDDCVEGPVKGFQHALAGIGVPGTKSAWWHRNMGLLKDKQITLELVGDKDSPVRALFKEKLGRDPTDEDAAAAYKLFLESGPELLDGPDEDGGRCTDLLPHTLAAQEVIKGRGLKIGGTTGFPKVLSDHLLRRGKEQGWAPDVWVAGDELPGSLGVRPSPHMNWLNLQRAGVAFPWLGVFADDTEAGCRAAVNAGCWVIGVYDSSTHNGAENAAAWRRTPEKDKVAAQRGTIKRLEKAGAHVIVPNLGFVEQALARIDALTRDGVLPTAAEEALVLDPEG